MPIHGVVDGELVLVLTNQTSFISVKKRLTITNVYFMVGEPKIYLVQRHKYLEILLD